MIRRMRVGLLGLVLATIIVGPAYADTGARPGSAEGSGSVASQGLTISPMNIEGADFMEGFESVSTLGESGWTVVNMSTTAGTTTWFQGNSGVFTAHAGATNQYVAANYNNTTGANTISNWLILPVQELRNGDEFAFWTRGSGPGEFADRLQVRVSHNGNSSDVGETAESVGDFAVLLEDINPGLGLNIYPGTWTRYSMFLEGLPVGASTQGRIAFRYYVTDGGPGGSNSNYIGIDTVSYQSYQPDVSVATTVSTVEGVCGADSSVVLNPLQTHWVCQTLTNTGTIALTDVSFEGPYAPIVGDLSTALGGPVASVAPGESVSWLFGSYGAGQDGTFETEWAFGNPGRGGDQLSAQSDMQITFATGEFTLQSIEADAVSADAGDDDVQLLRLIIGGGAGPGVAINGFEFTATNVVASGRAPGSVTLEDVIGAVSATISGTESNLNFTVNGNTVTATRGTPAIVRSGTTLNLRVAATTRSSIAGLAAAATLSALGLAALATRTRNRRMRIGALVLAVALTVAACGGGASGPNTVSFTLQLTGIDTGSVPDQPLPVAGPRVTVRY